jgi:hypothetical protein
MNPQFTINLAKESDNAELLKMCEVPMQGDILMSFERKPNYFVAASVQSEETRVYTCRVNKSYKLVGIFCIGKRRVFINDSIQVQKYFSDLRIIPEFHGSSLLYRIYKYIFDQDLLESKIAQTIIFEKNIPMLDLIVKRKNNKNYNDKFQYYPAGIYNSHMISLRGKLKLNRFTNCEIRRASKDDVGVMQEFLIKQAKHKMFYPYYNFENLNGSYFNNIKIENFYLAFQENKLTGMAGIWDQKEFKQTKIVGYSSLFSLLKPIINLYSKLTGGFELPNIGSVLNYLNVHTILIKEDNLNVFEEIIKQIIIEYKDKSYAYMLIGLDGKDALNQTLLKFKKRKLIKGRHFVVAKNEPDLAILNKTFYLEVSRI